MAKEKSETKNKQIIWIGPGGPGTFRGLRFERNILYNVTPELFELLRCRKGYIPVLGQRVKTVDIPKSE